MDSVGFRGQGKRGARGGENGGVVLCRERGKREERERKERGGAEEGARARVKGQERRTQRGRSTKSVGEKKKK